LLTSLLVVGIVTLSGIADVAGQGMITFLNFSNQYASTLVRTNSTGLGGGAGNTAPSIGGFEYGLFIAPSTVTSLSPLDLLTPPWTFTGVYATNTTAATGGRLNGGIDIRVAAWDGVTNSYVVAGWSANIALDNWSAVAAQLAGASFTNGVWSGPNWLGSSQGGFFGVSARAYGQAPDISSTLPPYDLFGSAPAGLGVPISTGFDLYVISPEPSIPRLAGVGLAVYFLWVTRLRLRR
jgi:hypothetical protein